MPSPEDPPSTPSEPSAFGLAASVLPGLVESLVPLLSQLSDALLAVGLDGTILSWLGGAEGLLGYRADEIVGQPSSQVLAPELAPARLVARLGESGSFAGPGWLRHRDGRQVHVETRASLLRAPDGQTVGVLTLHRDLTDRLHAETATREREWLEAVLDQVPTPLVFVAPATALITFTNRAADALWSDEGIPRSADRTSYTRSFEIHDRDGLPIAPDQTPAARVARGEAVRDLEMVWRTPQGDLPLLVDASTIQPTAGHEAIAVVAMRDISPIKRIERALDESRRLFEVLFDHLPAIAWSSSPTGVIEMRNQRWFEYFGPDTMREGWRHVHHADYYERVSAAWQTALQTGEPFEMEFPLRNQEGIYHWFLSRVNPLRDENGQIVRWFGMNANIDDQRRAQQRQQYLAQVSAAVAASVDDREAIEQTVLLSVPLFADGCVADYTHDDGRPEHVEARPDPSSSPPLSRLVPVSHPEAPASLRVGLASRGRAFGSLLFTRSRTSGRPRFSADDQTVAEEVARLLSIAVGNNRLHADLQASEHRYRSISQTLRQVIEQMPHAVIIAEAPSGRVVLANPPASQQLRLTLPAIDTVAGYSVCRGLYPDGRPYEPADWPLARSVQKGETVSNELIEIERGDATRAFIEYSSAPLRVADGSVSGAVMVGVDLTERLRQQRERESLIEALAKTNQDLDQFAYVASHDLKAPLRGIANLSHWIEEDLGDTASDETRQNLGLMRGRVQRLEGLIDGILSYSRAGRVRDKAGPVDTDALAREVVELLAPVAPARVEIAPGMPTVVAEKVPLQQVLMNLISNALKYGRRPDVVVTVRVEPGKSHHEFVVADNGPGIAPQFHERIWGIFQTLAPRDKVEGTGIGLSVVKKIVETRGGRVWVVSDIGQGAAFHFTWPRQPLLPGAEE